MPHISKKIKTLQTDLNTDLKATSEWLKANCLSLNVKKSQLLIFHSKFDIISISIKLERIKLIPSTCVKYLGFYIDEKILLLVYYTICYSQLLYGCPVWSLTTVNNINTIRGLQNKCIRIINNAPYNSHTNNLFQENKLLKLDYVIKIEQLKLVFLFKNGDLPK